MILLWLKPYQGFHGWQVWNYWVQRGIHAPVRVLYREVHVSVSLIKLGVNKRRGGFQDALPISSNILQRSAIPQKKRHFFVAHVLFAWFLLGIFFQISLRQHEFLNIRQSEILVFLQTHGVRTTPFRSWRRSWMRLTEPLLRLEGITNWMGSPLIYGVDLYGWWFRNPAFTS